MDLAYYLDYVYKNVINQYHGIPIIDYNPIESYAPPTGLDEDFNPIYSGGYKLVCWSKDGNYLKFRRPYAVDKYNCPHGMN